MNAAESKRQREDTDARGALQWSRRVNAAERLNLIIFPGLAFCVLQWSRRVNAAERTLGAGTYTPGN